MIDLSGFLTILKRTKFVIVYLLVILLILLCKISAFASSEVPTLQDYLKKVGNVERPKKEIIIEAINYTSSSNASVRKISQFYGQKDVLLWEKEGGWLEWSVNIPEDGFYNMALLYYPLPGKGLGIEFSVFIDGKIPYKEAQKVTFPRVWKDTTGIRKDKKGNDLRPKCDEHQQWQKIDFIDTEGFYNKDLQKANIKLDL